MEKNIGSIYLLQLCNEKNEKVYKIGKLKNIDLRLKNYTFKNILFNITVDDYEKKKN